MAKLLLFNQGRSATDAVAGSAAPLSPWPATSTAEQTAIDELTVVLGGGTEDQVRRLGSTAASLVERYAPGAPQPIKNEAVIRAAGWLRDQPSAAVSDEKVGELSVSYNPAAVSALRHSGAMALLTRWAVRRGGAIG